MDRYLIINADDFGMCRGANLAVMDLLTDKNSALTSSTIMTPCAWAPEAIRFAAKNPQYAIGVHLTLTSEWGNYRWAPVNTKNTDSLYKGVTKVEQEGEEGEKKLVYSVSYEDGVEVGRTLTETVVTKEAKNKVTLVGTKKRAVTSTASYGKKMSAEELAGASNASFSRVK